MLDALKFVVRRLEVLVRDEHSRHAMTSLDFKDLAPFFIEQESRYIYRHLHVNRRRVFLHRLFLNDAQHLQRGRVGITNMAGAVAARAGHMTALGQRRTQALTG